MSALLKLTLLEKADKKCVLGKQRDLAQVLWRINIICRVLKGVLSLDLSHTNAQDFHNNYFKN